MSACADRSDPLVMAAILEYAMCDRHAMIICPGRLFPIYRNGVRDAIARVRYRANDDFSQVPHLIH